MVDGNNVESCAFNIVRPCGEVYEFDIMQACGDPVLVTGNRFYEILDELKALHDRKNKDYGTNEDPLANIRASEEWGIPAWVGAMIRACDKIKRMKTYAQTGKLANEGMVDAFNDLAVYAIIGRMLFEETVCNSE